MVNGPEPGGRYYHTTTVVGSKVFVFGGRIGGKTNNDMWALDLNCRTFAIASPSYFDPISPYCSKIATPLGVI